VLLSTRPVRRPGVASDPPATPGRLARSPRAGARPPAAEEGSGVTGCVVGRTLEPVRLRSEGEGVAAGS
jgi:hypothetical protein